MDIRDVCDDFMEFNNLSVISKKTDNDVYDFDFRRYFETKSVINGTDKPVMLHIGAVEDYKAVEQMISEMGMKLLMSNEEHLKCSTIEGWYPILKDMTAFTKVYDKLPEIDVLMQDFNFPVFIKGNRQTNRHKRSQCIIKNEEDYEKIKKEWEADPILSWQKAVVREYLDLRILDDKKYPDMVQIGYEFRFFYFMNKLVGYGPYWYMLGDYKLDNWTKVVEITDEIAKKINVPFISIDMAQKKDGSWVLIEINDGQESGFVGVSAITLWNSIIENAECTQDAQNRVWIDNGCGEWPFTKKGMSVEDYRDETMHYFKSKGFDYLHYRPLWVQKEISKMNLLDKANFGLVIAKRGLITREEFTVLRGLSIEPEQEGRLGKVMGYSVSDYAIASWYWLGNEGMFHLYYDELDENRQFRVMELVKKEVYKEID